MLRPNQIEDARVVIANPVYFSDQPAMMAEAWARAKLARGQSVNFHRIGEPAYLIEAPLTATLDDIRHRSIAKIHARMRELGLDPLGGDAA